MCYMISKNQRENMTYVHKWNIHLEAHYIGDM